MSLVQVRAALCVLLLAVALGGCATSKNVRATTAAFDWSQTQKKVVIVQPDVVLSELTAGGMTEPRADWTKAALEAMSKSFDSFMARKNVVTVKLNELTDPHEIQLVKLHDAVGGAVIIHTAAGVKLPTKTSALDWTLGPGTNTMRDRYGADYAMFIFVRDSYATAGREAVIAGSLVLCAVTGVCPAIQGGTLVAFVSLVDLRTGNIVWFNLYGSEAGDLRTDKKMGEFVNTLLKEFPL
jgi:hypothetical protein